MSYICYIVVICLSYICHISVICSSYICNICFCNCYIFVINVFIIVIYLSHFVIFWIIPPASNYHILGSLTDLSASICLSSKSRLKTAGLCFQTLRKRPFVETTSWALIALRCQSWGHVLSNVQTKTYCHEKDIMSTWLSFYDPPRAALYRKKKTHLAEYLKMS